MNKPSKSKMKVGVVDDHPVVRLALKQLIGNEKDISVVGEAGSDREAMSMIAEKSPDVLILDISMDSLNGIELLHAVKNQYPGTKVIMFSVHDEMLYAERALKAGARGYVMKHEPPETLISAIRTVINGEVHMSEHLASHIVCEMLEAGTNHIHESGIDALSDRELEVFELIGHGVSTKEIASRLSLSVKTVETHRAHIKNKLNLTNGTELIQHAVLHVDRNY